MATRTPSPAQLAARAKFADMARSGGFAKRRKAAPKRKANPMQDETYPLGGSKYGMIRAMGDGYGGYIYTVFIYQKNKTGFGSEVATDLMSAKDFKTKNAAVKYLDSQKEIETLYRELAPTYNAASVAKAIKASRPKIGATEAKTINRLLMGRHGNPGAYREAGEFTMTVNGKSKTRFFESTDDSYANSYGFDYRLLSDVTKYGSPVKFTKTRAIVAVDEGADGKPITESWAIRGLKFYNTNPDKSKPRAYVRRVSQATGAPPSKRLTARRKMALEAPAGYFPNPKVKYTNRAKDLSLDERVGYSVHSATMPGHLGFAWFSKKADAVEAAQEASNRTGKQLAVSRMQIHFGPL